MNPFNMHFVAEFASLLTTMLIHFVWQGAALILIPLLTLKLVDLRSARVRYLISVSTLLLMGLAPIVTLSLCLSGPSNHSPAKTSDQSHSAIETHSAIGTVTVAGRTIPDTPTGSSNAGVQIYVLIAWLVGVFLFSTRLAIGCGVTWWVRANVKPLADELEERVRVLGDRLNLDARRRVFACARVSQAVAVGLIRPVVLIPAAWLTQCTPDVIEAVVAHELAHIRRWDLWVNLMQRVVETLLFFHPAVWWLSNRIRLEREMCCDEIAAECFDRVWYARSLESVARISHGNLLLATAMNGGRKMNLLARVRYVLGIAPADSTGNWWAVGCAAITLSLAGVVALSLSGLTTLTADKADQALVKAVAVRVQPTDVTVTEQYVGQVRSSRHIKIRSLVAGHLEPVTLTKGQRVKQGDLLFKISPILYKSKLDIENAEVRIAQQYYDDARKLYNDKLVSLNEVQVMETRLNKAQAKAQLAAGELNFAMITAPFDGIVENIDQGADGKVREGDALATLSDDSQMWVYFNVPEPRHVEYMAAPGQVKDNLKVELVLANGNTFTHAGKIGATEGNIDSATQNIPFRADFPNPEYLLRQGQSGTIRISRVLNAAVVIPQRATFEVLNKHYVFIVDQENVARQREIVIQHEIDDQFVIKNGVGAGDRIVLDGIRQIHDGEKVECQDPSQDSQ